MTTNKTILERLIYLEQATKTAFLELDTSLLDEGKSAQTDREDGRASILRRLDKLLLTIQANRTVLDDLWTMMNNINNRLGKLEAFLSQLEIEDE